MTLPNSPVPLNFRAHLIPFLRCELYGVLITSGLVETTIIKIDPGSSVGKFIVASLKSHGIYIDPGTQLYMRFDVFSKELESTVYTVFRKIDKILYVPIECKREINDFVEDIFRVAMQFHVAGMQKINPKMTVKECLEDFMIQYRMDDFGFEVESLRKVLTRNKEYKIKRMQNHTPFYNRS